RVSDDLRTELEPDGRQERRGGDDVGVTGGLRRGLVVVDGVEVPDRGREVADLLAADLVWLGSRILLADQRFVQGHRRTSSFGTDQTPSCAPVTGRTTPDTKSASAE